MKNLKAVAVTLAMCGAGLLGCGPQQSSTERDQQQIQAEAQRLREYFKPFAGTYVGTAYIQGKTQVEEKEISLYLEPADDATSDVSRLQNTAVPSLKGQFLQCLTDAPCFNVDPLDESNANKVAIVKGVYNSSNTLTTRIFSSGGAATGSGSSCLTGTDCTPYYYDITRQADGSLTGTIWVGKNVVGPFKVNRR